MIRAIADNSGISTDRITNDTTPVLTVVAEPGASLRVEQNGVVISKAYTVVESANSPGTYTISFTEVLDDGSYGVRVIDRAGNTSNLLAGDQPFNYRIDSTRWRPKSARPWAMVW